MKTLVTALLLLCSVCASAAGNGVKVPPFERVQLPNGAVLLLMERHDVPLIAFTAVLRGGALSDPAGESGVASLLAGMLQRPRLDTTQFDTLRARQIEFIRAAKESDLAALAPIYGEAYLFGGHP